MLGDIMDGIKLTTTVHASSGSRVRVTSTLSVAGKAVSTHQKTVRNESGKSLDEKALRDVLSATTATVDWWCREYQLFN